MFKHRIPECWCLHVCVFYRINNSYCLFIFALPSIFFPESFESKLQISTRPRLGNFPELLILCFSGLSFVCFPTRTAFSKQRAIQWLSNCGPWHSRRPKRCISSACVEEPLCMPWPDWAAKVVVSLQTLPVGQGYDWKLGRVQTGGSDSTVRHGNGRERAVDN